MLKQVEIFTMALAWGIQGLVVMALSYAIAVMKKRLVKVTL
ncbi:Uncharacterised protein [Salmonella enterica subsp. arizonae]|uniref:Uncharacterized protein n=1 Tax=Salmonella enterica subsp. arizonae TaxID=59203 RepID=A0A2X4WSV4_SALER|nr:Uncharacterised protein [Salmonella enterica subsp. arizonae]